METPTPQYDIFSLGFDKFLSRENPLVLSGINTVDSLPSILGSVIPDGTDPTDLKSGEWVGNISVKDGYLQSSNYVAATSGWRLTPTSGEINFSLSILAGAIGGFDIGADYIRDAANTFGLASTVTVGDDVRFWAGDTFANRATADFRVTEAGVVNASKMTISGGADVSFISDTLDTSTKTILKDFTFGSTDYSGAFKTGDITWNTTTGAITGGSGGLFNKNGLIFASAGVSTITLDGITGSATFAGKITASEGSIGGWSIASGYLYTSTEIAGFNTGLLSPTASGGKYNNWTDPTNAYSSNNVYATQTARSLGYWNIPQSYETFGISILQERLLRE